MAEPRPPRDERIGAKFGKQDHPSIRLVGFVKKRRYLVEVDGKEAWIRLGSFQCLAKLMAPLLKQGPPGWVPDVEIGEPAHGPISRLKEDLREAMGIDSHIVNDGHGKYRISIPPENLAFAQTPMQADHPMLFDLLTK